MQGIWYRFVLSFPPHLVREYISRFDLGSGARVLDPFCGTGTTIVECKKNRDCERWGRSTPDVALRIRNEYRLVSRF